MTPEQHREAVLAWREARERRLREPDGWLTLVGLHWLVPGENRFGADAGNDIVLRGSDVPPHAGILVREGDAVRLRRDGRPDTPLRPDLSGEPTGLEIGSLRMHVIQRGDRFGLRVRDHAAPTLGAFRRMEHFPIDFGWRLTGRLEPAEPGATLEIMDVTGLASREPTPGVIAFEREGLTWRLHALPGDDEGTLWLVFADATSGGTTYGGGRFLHTEPVAPDGTVVVDFNLAYNPPCVFTPFATCPLPPAANRLALEIEAGELDYADAWRAGPHR